jgi:hypothetical protein
MREVIFEALVELEGRQKQHNGYVVADGIIAALGEAGCFVLGPDPLAWSDDEYDRIYLAVDARLAHEARRAFAAAMADDDA